MAHHDVDINTFYASADEDGSAKDPGGGSDLHAFPAEELVVNPYDAEHQSQTGAAMTVRGVKH